MTKHQLNNSGGLGFQFNLCALRWFHGLPTNCYAFLEEIQVVMLKV